MRQPKSSAPTQSQFGISGRVDKRQARSVTRRIFFNRVQADGQEIRPKGEQSHDVRNRHILAGRHVGQPIGEKVRCRLPGLRLRLPPSREAIPIAPNPKDIVAREKLRPSTSSACAIRSDSASRIRCPSASGNRRREIRNRSTVMRGCPPHSCSANLAVESRSTQIVRQIEPEESMFPATRVHVLAGRSISALSRDPELLLI